MKYSWFLAFAANAFACLPLHAGSFEGCSLLSGIEKDQCEFNSKSCSEYTTLDTCVGTNRTGGGDRCIWNDSYCVPVGTHLQSSPTVTYEPPTGGLYGGLTQIDAVFHQSQAISVEYTNCNQAKVNAFGRQVGCDRRERHLFNFSADQIAELKEAVKQLANTLNHPDVTACMKRNFQEFYTFPANIFSNQTYSNFLDSQFFFFVDEDVRINLFPVSIAPDTANNTVTIASANLGTIVYNPATGTSPESFKAPGYNPPSKNFRNINVNINIQAVKPQVYTTEELAGYLAHELFHQMGHNHISQIAASQFIRNDSVYELGHCVANRNHGTGTANDDCVSTYGGTLGTKNGANYCDHTRGTFLSNQTQNDDVHFITAKLPETSIVMARNYELFHERSPTSSELSLLLAKSFAGQKTENIVLNELFQSTFSRPPSDEELSKLVFMVSAIGELRLVKNALKIVVSEYNRMYLRMPSKDEIIREILFLTNNPGGDIYANILRRKQVGDAYVSFHGREPSISKVNEIQGFALSEGLSFDVAVQQLNKVEITYNANHILTFGSVLHLPLPAVDADGDPLTYSAATGFYDPTYQEWLKQTAHLPPCAADDAMCITYRKPPCASEGAPAFPDCLMYFVGTQNYTGARYGVLTLDNSQKTLSYNTALYSHDFDTLRVQVCDSLGACNVMEYFIRIHANADVVNLIYQNITNRTPTDEETLASLVFLNNGNSTQALSQNIQTAEESAIQLHQSNCQKLVALQTHAAAIDAQFNGLYLPEWVTFRNQIQQDLQVAIDRQPICPSYLNPASENSFAQKISGMETLFLANFNWDTYELAACGSTPHGTYGRREKYKEATVPYGSFCEREDQYALCNNGVLSAWSGSFAASNCTVQNLDSDGDGIPDTMDQCPGDNDAQIVAKWVDNDSDGYWVKINDQCPSSLGYAIPPTLLKVNGEPYTIDNDDSVEAKNYNKTLVTLNDSTMSDFDLDGQISESHSVYLIANPYQWLDYASKCSDSTGITTSCNKNVKLVQNLDFSNIELTDPGHAQSSTNCDMDLDGNSNEGGCLEVLSIKYLPGAPAHDTWVSGVIDGSNYKFMNLKVSVLDKDEIGALARSTWGAVIRNIELQNIAVQGRDKVGSIAGWFDGGVLNKVTTTGVVKGRARVGGVAGEMSTSDAGTYPFRNVSGILNNSTVLASSSGLCAIGGVFGIMGGEYPAANMSQLSNHADVIAPNCTWVGGLVGLMSNQAKVSDSYNSGNVTGSVAVGGIVGLETTTGKGLNKVYSSGNITAVNSAGFIAGEHQSNSALLGFWLSAATISGGIDGVGSGQNSNTASKTLAQFKEQGTWTNGGWLIGGTHDYSKVWFINEGSTFPAFSILKDLYANCPNKRALPGSCAP